MDLLSIFCVMGFPTIDKSLEGLLSAMHNAPQSLGQLTTLAKTIGCCIALGVGANECYQMMLGRRGMDVMKLIHILIISLCISFSGSIVAMAKSPGLALEKWAQEQMTGKNGEVIALEEDVAKLQADYLKKVNKVLAEAQVAKQNDREKDTGIIEDLKNSVDDMIDNVKAGLIKMAMFSETKVCEWFSLIIRFLGELIFQMSYYGMLVAQRVFMAILEMFCPIMFAISLSPHFKSAWSQWLSKYLTLSLWGFITYVVIYYINFILVYNLQQDIAAYQRMMGEAGAMGTTIGWEQVGTLGMQGLGSTCMYVMALMAGAYIIRMVPEVASWCIPGGVSSGAGEKSGSLGMAAVSGAVGGAISSSIPAGKKSLSFADKTLRTTENVIYGTGSAVVSGAKSAYQSARRSNKSSGNSTP